MTNPTLIIFAGANGAGKTTVAKLLLPKLRIREFVNADEIARGLSPLNPTGQAVAAGRLVYKRIDELIARRESFAIETTLSGHAQYKKLRQAKEAGYKIEMHYMFCNDLEANIKRVVERVKQGGHGVPEADIRRRYWRSLRNLIPYARVYDILNVYDTTAGSHKHILQAKPGVEAEVFEKFLSRRFFNRLIEAIDGH